MSISYAVGAVGLEGLWSSVRAGFFMFWETLWALALGFSLSGAIRAFIARRSVEQRLGRPSTGNTVRAASYGAASSSCSYAASSIAKSLFAKGADFTMATVFMVASTNLVIELGVVLAALLGWRFVLAELFGGTVMISVLALLGPRLFPERVVVTVRETLAAASGPTAPGEAKGSIATSRTHPWTAAAGYTVSDARMLRLELFIGFLGAGVAAELVPKSWWAVLFLHGHGAAAALENALVGPLIAFASFVCSVGNVPLAAALWHVGISFAGVVTFVFADLVAAPLVLVYRRYYGRRLAVRLVGVLYVSMVVAGLVTEWLFSLLGLEPTKRPQQVAPERFNWNYTTILDLLAIGGALVVYAAYRRGKRRDGGLAEFATDPVCGMQVRITDAPASTNDGNQTTWFCSDQCAHRFRETRDSTPVAAPRHRSRR